MSELIYSTAGTVVTFAPTGGTITWTPTSLALSNARISNVWDRGSGAIPMRYRWRCSTKWVATPTAGDNLRLYVVTSNAIATASLTDGGLTFGDATLTSEATLQYNCTFLGPVGAATATDQAWCSSGLVYLWSRYIAIAGWNAAGAKALSATNGDHVFTFTPVSDDIQS